MLEKKEADGEKSRETSVKEEDLRGVIVGRAGRGESQCVRRAL